MKRQERLQSDKLVKLKKDIRVWKLAMRESFQATELSADAR